MFFEKYREKLVADFSYLISKDRKRIALAWYRRSEYYKNRKVVSSMFQKLGIIDLEELCERNKGFRVCAKPEKQERYYIKVLEEATKDILFDILSYDSMPKCEVVLNPETPIEGCAVTKKIKGKRQQQSGFKAAREISKVYLQKYLFHEENFGEAFSVYAHELLHQYGGEASLQFHKALLEMNKRIIENSEKLDKYELRWRGIA